jgi:hypothetical protein
MPYGWPVAHSVASLQSSSSPSAAVVGIGILRCSRGRAIIADVRSRLLAKIGAEG